MALKNKLYIVPYKSGSEGMGLLCDKLDILACRVDGTSKVLKNPGSRVLLYWGQPNVAVQDQLRVHYYRGNPPKSLNNYANIRYAVNKIEFFNTVNGRPWALDFTTNKGEALAWIEDEDCKVIARATATGSGGEGIKVIRTIDDWKDMDKYVLFTKYVPKKCEYRIHVFDGKVIYISRKVMPNGKTPEGDNWEVRSHDNGFIFQREEQANVPQACIDAAIQAVSDCGLLFAGADVIWNAKRNKAYVCELNSAPGIEGNTVDAYANAIREIAKQRFGIE